ncbi:MAG: hypothetical protein N3A38_12155 [Planctomycetota bacterium]|nr:hypothetical protein [Planctomycetota bacterium]
MSDTERRIRRECRRIAEALVAKNQAYGDSALRPAAIFATGDAEANIRARIDDKLARIRVAPGAFGEDAIADLIGYLVLLRLAMEDKEKARGRAGKEARWRRRRYRGRSRR